MARAAYHTHSISGKMEWERDLLMVRTDASMSKTREQREVQALQDSPGKASRGPLDCRNLHVYCTHCRRAYCSHSPIHARTHAATGKGKSGVTERLRANRKLRCMGRHCHSSCIQVCMVVCESSYLWLVYTLACRHDQIIAAMQDELLVIGEVSNTLTPHTSPHHATPHPSHNITHSHLTLHLITPHLTPHTT